MIPAGKIFVLITATLCLRFASPAQNIADLYDQGLSYEKSFRDSLALEKYENVLKFNPNNVDALTHASRMYSNIAGRMSDQTNRRLFTEHAKSLSQKAIALDHHHKEAHLNFVIALGLLADAATSSSEKLQHAKIIRQEADFLIRLDSTYAPAFFILGRWNLALSRLSWFEKLACDVLFGGVPEGASMKNAIDCFDKAIALQPDYIIFHYNRALAYFYSGKYHETRASLSRAFSIPQKDPDDKIRLQQCYSLLRETSERQTTN